MFIFLVAKTAVDVDHAFYPAIVTHRLQAYVCSNYFTERTKVRKVKAFPYSIPSVGPGADVSVQAVNPQVTVSHPPGGRLPLLSATLAVTSPAAEHHRPLAGTKLYCLMTEAHRCEQFAKVVTQGCLEYDLNLRPTDRKSNALPVALPRHQRTKTMVMSLRPHNESVCLKS